jgi:hypothetical protein
MQDVNDFILLCSSKKNHHPCEHPLNDITFYTNYIIKDDEIIFGFSPDKQDRRSMYFFGYNTVSKNYFYIHNINGTINIKMNVNKNFIYDW